MDWIVDTTRRRLQLIADHLALRQTDRSYLRRYIRISSQGEFHKDIR